MGEVNISLISARGEALPLASAPGDVGNYILRKGAEGLGVPTPAVIIDESAGLGARYRGERIPSRSLRLPFMVVGDDRASTRDRVRNLRRILRVERNLPLPRLRADYNTGLSIEIGLVYKAGLETTIGPAGTNLFDGVVTFSCPMPYWQTTEWQPLIALAGAGTSSDLLANLAALPLASSSVIGNASVQNVGDVDAYPVWTFSGVCTGLTITTDLGTFTYGAIPSGEVRVFDTGAKTVVDASGTNKYSGLAAAPQFGALPTGQSNVSISATGTDSSSSLIGRYKPRYELVH